jgi:hypothetical protein
VVNIFLSSDPKDADPTTAKENELKRPKTATDGGFLAMKNSGPQKAREFPLLGIGEERKR